MKKYLERYLERFKKNAQLTILVGNTLLVCFNLAYIGIKFDNIEKKQVFTCEMIGPYTSQCYER